ncbi:MAG: class I SAM-dependent rRNA methyltransferase [Bacteroidetes bacterium]|nr:MAG: class I SAM-dependent rRNA methyltransferase [Bacteroidota bacterium]
MNTLPQIRLKPGKEASLQRFHPWVFSGAIASDTSGLEEGQTVEVYAHDHTYLGTGHFQPGSIAVRIFSFQQQPIDAAFWESRLLQALSLRQSAGLLQQAHTNMFRLVHGEGDGFPGLIVDVYNGLAVLQCHSMGFYRMRELITHLLLKLPGIKLRAVYDKSAHSLPFPARPHAQDAYLHGQPEEWVASEYGDQYYIEVEQGQKTGFFIDQRENRRLLRQYAAGRSLLNAFCYTGGFSVAALRGQAAAVTSVDSSQYALELCDKNVSLNFGQQAPHQSLATNAFEMLNQIDQQYDLIVLDPPAFAKHHKVLSRALKGYRKINRRAIAQIRPNGILFTFSCSQAVSRDAFRKTIFTSAALAGRKVRILHQLSQPADHPISIYHPEGEYLKGLVLAVE